MREWLTKIREQQGMQQKDVALSCNISRQYYNYIESGERRPSPKVAQKIATTLGFPETWYRLLLSDSEICDTKQKTS